MKILLTSISKIKLQALTEFAKEFTNLTISTYDCSGCNLPNQPFGTDKGTFHCAKERINYVTKNIDPNEFDYIVSIENGIVYTNKILFDNGVMRCKTMDVCCVLILHRGLLSASTSFGIPLDEKYISKLIQENTLIRYNKYIEGYNITLGNLIKQDIPDIDPTNWMKTLNNIDRFDQIIDGLHNCFSNLHDQLEIRNEIISGYKIYNNFPKPNISFQDIFSVFKDSHLLYQLTQLLIDRYKYDNIDYIIGLESRGLCLGILLAYKLKIGFIPIRKEGKLPGEVIKISYEKEYGKDTCEIQKNIEKNSRVLIIDDLIATGGSIKAAIELLNNLDCIIVDCCVLREVKELREQCIKTVPCSYSVLLND